jgi:threonine dehydrogenase-like Zn-dependent dehydrogenase
MNDTVLAATLVAPFDLRVQRYPYPSQLEPGAVLLRMLASGICGTDKHTYRGETEQYVGTEHASSTPFPIIQGHENVGVLVDIGPGGATAFDGTPLAVGDRVVPAPNRACGRCRFCTDTSRTTSAGSSRTTATRSPRPTRRTSSAVGRSTSTCCPGRPSSRSRPSCRPRWPCSPSCSR